MSGDVVAGRSGARFPVAEFAASVGPGVMRALDEIAAEQAEADAAEYSIEATA